MGLGSYINLNQQGINGVYLMAGYTFINIEKLDIFYSFDALNWLPKAISTYSGANGFTVRDPSLTYWNGYFWVCYTESTYNGGLFTVGHTWGLAKSTDLVNWTWVADVSVANTVGSGDNYYTWQPCYFEDADGDPHVFVCCSAPGSGQLPGNDSTIYEQHPTNADWTTWSDPVPVLDLPSSLIPQNVWYDPSTGLYSVEGFGWKPFTSYNMMSGYVTPDDAAWTPLGFTDGFSLCFEEPGTYVAFADWDVQVSGNAIEFAKSFDAGANWVTQTGLCDPSIQHFINPSMRFYPPISEAYVTALSALR